MNSSIIDDEPLVTLPPLKKPLHNSSLPRDQEPDHTDLAALRKWQEDRHDRRVRGEYESAVRHLGQVINGNLDRPTRIASVRVVGASRTRAGFLESLIQPQVTHDAIPLQEILQRTRNITGALEATEVFKFVAPSLTRSVAPSADPEDVDIVLKCVERGKWFLKTATDVGNQEGSATATAKILNAFGGAETVEGNVSFGTKTKQAFQLRLDAPLVALDQTLRTHGEISAFGAEKDNSTFASSREGIMGVKAAIRTISSLGSHQLAYELTSRHIGSLSPTASISVREVAGHTIKSAITHTFLSDTRDDTMCATKGSYTKISQELAGLGGDPSHFKSESAYQISRPLFVDGLSLSVSACTGLLYPLNPNKKSCFSDRFQLGGPLSVRMFKNNALGPRDGDDSLGGDMYWSTGVSLVSNIPKKPQWPLKLHAFVNAGRLDELDRQKSFTDNVKACLSRPSISAGVGLIYRFDPIRVEVNFGVPLVASKTDGTRKGFQVGMGLEFL